MRDHNRSWAAVLSLSLMLLARTVCADTLAPQRIVWQKTPIAVVLTVGEERLLHFRAPVSVGVPAALQPSLRTQTVNGTVYLMPLRPFGRSRIMVREVDGGQTYLFDLSASTTHGESAPMVVSLDEAAIDVRASNERDARPRYDYVSLTRYAAQQLYAPRRLLSSHPGIVRVPVREDRVALVPGAAIEARPLLAWRAGPLYVTAVRLTNRTRNPQVLDPRTLRGAWLSAAFQHARLLPAGDEADTTAVYLVSAQPFEAAL